MRGMEDKRDVLFIYVSPEDFVPADHPRRPIRTMVDQVLESHTISQFDQDSQPRMPLVLAGQNNLVDKLMFHALRPIALRIIGRSHLENLKLKDMRASLNHHLQIAGVKERLFAEEATLAIHQGSGGLLRRANLLAKGVLTAAGREKCQNVSAEHVRVAATEIM